MRKNNIYIVIIILILFGCNSSPYNKLKYILDIKDIDFKSLNSGKYRGDFTHYTYEWEVEATVRDGKVTDIEIIKSHDSYLGIKAREVLDRVIDEQSLQVDCVTGATNASKAFLKSTENALEKGL
jgi:uncharacterized protein with FMN-binding domain